MTQTPSQWIGPKGVEGKVDNVSFSCRNLRISISDNAEHQSIFTFRSDFRIPPYKPFYFEITAYGYATDYGQDILPVNIGLGHVCQQEKRMLHFHWPTKQTGCKNNDVIGCGLNSDCPSGYFTKNGKMLVDFEVSAEATIAMSTYKHFLYPVIGVGRGIAIDTNFGQHPFRYRPQNDILLMSEGQNHSKTFGKSWLKTFGRYH